MLRALYRNCVLMTGIFISYSGSIQAQTSVLPMADFPTTQIKLFAPWNYPPALSSGLTIIKEVSGYCWSGSIANPRPDAWRCNVGNEIEDPCFSNFAGAGADKVACVRAPWNKKVTVIKLTKPLPLKSANQQNYLSHKPWAVEFFNGTRCVYDLTGTVSMIAGMTTSSSCLNLENHAIAFTAFDQINRTQPLWRVFIQQNPLFLEQMPIKTAWF